MKTLIPAFSVLILLTGCAGLEMKYVNRDAPGQISGGYSEDMVSNNEYVVTFEGKPFTSPESIRRNLIKRVTELCGVDNYSLSDPASSSKDHMVMAGGVFMASQLPISTIKASCNTTKREYLLKHLVENGSEYCDITVYNSTGYFTRSFSIDVYINEVYITSLQYKQFTVVPIQKGSNTIATSKPFSTKRKELEFQINTCSEQIEVNHNISETLRIFMHVNGEDFDPADYKPNIKELEFTN